MPFRLSLVLKCTRDLNISWLFFFFWPPDMSYGEGPRLPLQHVWEGLCLFQHRTAEGVPKELDFFPILLLSCSPPNPPGFALSLTLLVRIFWTPCECFWPWLLPVGWGRVSGEWIPGSYGEHLGLYLRRDVRLYGVLWRSLSRHGNYWHILKKIKTKFLKVMTFLLKATGHASFLILTKLFLVARNFTAHLA